MIIKLNKSEVRVANGSRKVSSDARSEIYLKREFACAEETSGERKTILVFESV